MDMNVIWTLRALVVRRLVDLQPIGRPRPTPTAGAQLTELSISCDLLIQGSR
jgi:hypothetical protein